MTKQLLRLSTAVLISLTSAGSQAQDGGGLSDPKVLACDVPVLSKDAAVYGLEGEAEIVFDLQDTGQPANARVLRSSGWKSLDEVALRAITRCRYAPPSDAGVKRSGIIKKYKVALDPPGQEWLAASLVPGSCAASDRFAEFRPMSGPVKEGEGLLVRFRLDQAGTPSGVKLEGSASPEIGQAAAAYLGSCRFVPARYKALPSHGAMYGRLITKTE